MSSEFFTEEYPITTGTYVLHTQGFVNSGRNPDTFFGLLNRAADRNNVEGNPAQVSVERVSVPLDAARKRLKTLDDRVIDVLPGTTLVFVRGPESVVDSVIASAVQAGTELRASLGKRPITRRIVAGRVSA